MKQPETIDQFVERQLKDGVFGSYEEMVSEALRLLQERVQSDREIADELRPAFERGKSGHPGMTVTLEDVKLLSEQFRTQENLDAS